MVASDRRQAHLVSYCSGSHYTCVCISPRLFKTKTILVGKTNQTSPNAFQFLYTLLSILLMGVCMALVMTHVVSQVLYICCLFYNKKNI